MSDLLKGVNLCLIGMMGVGKTTIGRLLAKELNYHFFDTDTLIEQLTGQSIVQIFAQSGEAEFRQMETQVLAQLSAHTRKVIATGGGIVLRRENWSYLRHGLVIWLDVPVEQLYNRLKRDQTRPLLKDADPLEKLRQLFQERQALYRQADVHIAIARDSTAEQVAAQVLAEIPKVLRSAEDG